MFSLAFIHKLELPRGLPFIYSPYLLASIRLPDRTAEPSGAHPRARHRSLASTAVCEERGTPHAASPFSVPQLARLPARLEKLGPKIWQKLVNKYKIPIGLCTTSEKKRFLCCNY